MAKAPDGLRDRLMVDWAVKYGLDALPKGERARVRAALIDFAAEILGSPVSNAEMTNEIVSRYAERVS